MAILLHGTTRHRAKQIAAHGPDPKCCGPYGFSTYLEAGPFPLLPPDEYARRKAALFPNDEGPAILAIDVPDDIIALAVDEVYFPRSQGLVQFDEDAGLEELRVAWSTLWKEIRSVEGP